MSKALSGYGNLKSTAITTGNHLTSRLPSFLTIFCCTATRLGDLLGTEMTKDPGLNCKFVIANVCQQCCLSIQHVLITTFCIQKPAGALVTQRAVPVAVFEVSEARRRLFLTKWLGGGLHSYNIRDIVDWDYYIQRLGNAIQKIITIPAALQHVPNPVPRGTSSLVTLRCV